MNKLKFEFDFDEVFEGIKQGVIRELSDVDFGVLKSEIIKDLKAEFKSNVNFDWKDEQTIKEEIKNEIIEKVYNKLIDNLNINYKQQFEKTMDKWFGVDGDTYTYIIDETIVKVSNDVENKIYSGVKKDIDNKMKGIFQNIDKTFNQNVNVENSKTITKEQYNQLLKDSAKLSALEAGGVANWEWYGESLEEYYKEYENDEE